uniref:Wall-associated receptor kinase C-terminal domain-containing protein n=1 Tax=Aegilops tauschii subsp. strangulata TaxID=200361 RepID=A0A453FBH3_AEGTS
DYGGVLKQGFELEWKMGTAQPCDLCEKSYGRCAYSEKKQFLACLCSGGNCKSSGITSVYSNPPSSRRHSKDRTKICKNHLSTTYKLFCKLHL